MPVQHTNRLEGAVEDGGGDHELPLWISVPAIIAALVIWGSQAHNNMWLQIPHDNKDIIWRLIASGCVLALTIFAYLINRHWKKVSSVLRFIFATQFISWYLMMPVYGIVSFTIPILLFVFVPQEAPWYQLMLGAMALGLAITVIIDAKEFWKDIKPENPWRAIYAVWTFLIIGLGYVSASWFQDDARQWYYGQETQIAEVKEETEEETEKPIASKQTIIRDNVPESIPLPAASEALTSKVAAASSKPETLTSEEGEKNETAASNQPTTEEQEVAVKMEQAVFAALKERIAEVRVKLDHTSNASLRRTVIGRLITVAVGAELPTKTHNDKVIHEIITQIQTYSEDTQFILMTQLVGTEEAIRIEERRIGLQKAIDADIKRWGS